MGVPYLYYNLYKKYKFEKELLVNEYELQNIVKNSENKLFFDFNSLIHPCAHNVLQSELGIEQEEIKDKIIEYVLKCTENIIKMFNIELENVCIIADGVAPLPKILQQRERRFKTTFINLETDKKSLFDTNQISPGTEFMNELEEKLKIKFPKVLIDFSYGEAEHKILQIIKKENNKQNFIYGLYADLIVMSLMCDKIQFLLKTLKKIHMIY
jgi:5'-3' exonuclease